MTATAESLNDVQALINMHGKRVVKKHKKHQHEKICDVCGKKCRGIKGLGVHKAHMHKENVPNQNL